MLINCVGIQIPAASVNPRRRSADFYLPVKIRRCDTMRIRWHGHSCFEFDDSGNVVVIDPHDGKSIGIRPPAVAADIVLMTHDHYDHNASRVIRGDHRDFKFSNGRRECRGFVFEGFPTFHDDAGGEKRGANTIYRFEMDGMSLCHCGDIGDIPSDEVIEAIKGVYFLFVPTGEIYTMTIEVLKEFLIRVNPRIIVPMHHRVGGLTIPLTPLDDFLDILPEGTVEYVGNEVDLSGEELPDRKECWVFSR